VVNPSGVAMPMVGWKRAPLSAVAPISEVTSDKCFVYILPLEIHRMIHICICS
jgi:hypothetical protein